jgi:hypothetical protein
MKKSRSLIRVFNWGKWGRPGSKTVPDRLKKPMLAEKEVDTAKLGESIKEVLGKLSTTDRSKWTHIAVIRER